MGKNEVQTLTCFTRTFYSLQFIDMISCVMINFKIKITRWQDNYSENEEYKESKNYRFCQNVIYIKAII